jgi:hypothetical protein
MAKKSARRELPADNDARIAIYDAMCEVAGSPRATSRVIATETLFDQVIDRLRILVPRELRLSGERLYFDEKIQTCVDAGIVRRSGDGLTLGEEAPFVQYPDGEIRSYTAGLQAARARLKHDDASLRRAGFDPHRFVPSVADARRSPAFRVLVASMREHGFLKQFPIVRGADGAVVDGRARIAAAEVAGVKVIELSEDDRPPNRLDTPLHRVLLLLAVNANRLTDENRDALKQAVAEKVGRSWAEIESDLALTHEWRRAVPRQYVAKLDVREVRFRPDEAEPTILVTTDERVRVGLRKLVVAAGLSPYKMQTELRGYVVEELARTQLTSKPATFVEISNAIEGIGKMQSDRRAKNLKLDPQWETVRQWLVAQRRARASSRTETETPSEAILPVEQSA